MKSGKQSDPLSLGDSIGLLSLLSGFLAFVVSPPPILKAFLLASTVCALCFFIWRSRWSHSYRPSSKLLLATSCGAGILYLGLSQMNREHPFFAQISAHVHIWLKTSLVQRCIWFTLGVLCLRGLQLLRDAFKQRLMRGFTLANTDKGFLDYKLQAERSMAQLPIEVGAITSIVADVGKAMEQQTKKMTTARLQPTRKQMQLVAQTARLLDGCTRGIEAKGRRLEDIATSLNEGLTGWLRWMHGQPNGKETISPLLSAMKTHVEILRASDVTSDGYLIALKGMRGVSQHLTIAIDAYLASFERIRKVNAGIADSSEAVIRLFDAA